MLSLVTLAGCGLTPVYGTGTGWRHAIAFQTPDTVAGFRLRERFEQRMGVPAQGASMRLDVTLSSSRQPATITSTGDTTRFNLVGSATWTLVDLQTRKPIETGKVDTFTSYAATGSTVGTQAAETDAAARLSVALADMIVARLLILSQDADK